MLEMDYQSRGSQIPTDFSTVSVTPKLLYILSDGIGEMNEYDANVNGYPGADINHGVGVGVGVGMDMMKKNEVLVFNHTCDDLSFSVSV